MQVGDLVRVLVGEHKEDFPLGMVIGFATWLFLKALLSAALPIKFSLFVFIYHL